MNDTELGKIIGSKEFDRPCEHKGVEIYDTTMLKKDVEIASSKFGKPDRFHAMFI